jgi:hypothetical protein
MPETPPNIDEFNKIAGLAFAQLYREFPVPVDINRGVIAKALGVPEKGWPEKGWGDFMLPSGRSFATLLNTTIAWLKADEYTMAPGSDPSKSVVLTTRGLRVMNAVPSPLKETVGTELQRATEPNSGAFDLSKIGDLIGGTIGGLWKSVGS